MIKMSFCFLYLRIFPDRAFRRYLWGTQIFNVVLPVTFVIVNLLQCKPLSWFWIRLDTQTSETGRCVNINVMAWSHAILNIVLDIWMLLLPAGQIWGLKMEWKRKFRVFIMFTLGALYVPQPSLIQLLSSNYGSCGSLLTLT